MYFARKLGNNTQRYLGNLANELYWETTSPDILFGLNITNKMYVEIIDIPKYTMFETNLGRAFSLTFPPLKTNNYYKVHFRFFYDCIRLPLTTSQWPRIRFNNV